jgi:hypothetical protein
MTLLHSLRMIFRLAGAAALLAVTEAGPSFLPGSPAGESRPSNRTLLVSPALSQPGTAGASATPRLQNFGRIPLSFEANQGQTEAQVQYLARGSGYTVFLAATEAVLALNSGGVAADSLRSPVLTGKSGMVGTAVASSEEREGPVERAVLRMQLLGSNPAAQAKGADRLPGIANYFLGNDASKWRTGIPTYARVQYQEVYPGISLVYYGNQRQLEYDFQVAPGADPSQIRLRFAGAESLSVDDRGDLAVQAGGQVLLQHKPIVYQEAAGERREVAANFVVQGQEVGFALGDYDHSRPVVIDPVLSYSTYLGGRGVDAGVGIAVDAAGNAYVTGATNSPDFPTANALQPRLHSVQGVDAFVTKLTADGSALAYSTYLGGSGNDSGWAIGVDADGNAYVTGTTVSSDFPTMNPLQPHLGHPGAQNAFVAKLTADGSALVYSTYLGGSGGDIGIGIAVDSIGNAYVAGRTSSPDFPTVNPLQLHVGGPLNQNAFVAKLTADGSALEYSTYLGGSGGVDRAHGIAVDAAGNAYVTGDTDSPDFPTINALQPTLLGGDNAFVSKLTPDGSALAYSTYLGGSGFDQGWGIAVDAAGNAYVTGSTTSPDFPTVNPLQTALGTSTDTFVSKLSADGSALVYSTYLGGSGEDIGWGIAVDAAGNAYVAGSTDSPDFPTVNALQPTLLGGFDIFVTELTADGSALVYSTYLGPIYSVPFRIAVDGAGNAYVTGATDSPDFPTANAMQPALKGGANAFVAKINP